MIGFYGVFIKWWNGLQWHMYRYMLWENHVSKKFQMAHIKEKKIQFLWFGHKSPKSSHSCCSTWGKTESCVNKNYTKSHWKGRTETSLLQYKPEACTSVCFAAIWRVSWTHHTAALLSQLLTPRRNVPRLCLCDLLHEPECFKNVSLYHCSWHSSRVHKQPHLHNFWKL